MPDDHKTAAVWLDATEAARQLDVPISRLKAIARDGLIGVRSLPKVRARYSARDVSKLATQQAAVAK